MNQTAEYVLRTVPRPTIDAVGGEWAVLGLARSGFDVPDSYFENYYRTVADYLRANGGVLHERRFTEYSRVILALTAAGYDARDVTGFDLTANLGDFERTVWQGINGAVFALLALDSGDYPIPLNTNANTQATRELYISDILRRQLPDGGFSLSGNAPSDPDVTAMALQAFAKYQSRTDVKAAIDKAIEFLSSAQQSCGGFSSRGSVNLESTVQVLVALCELDIKTQHDRRFRKGGNGLLESILSFQNSDGSFNHRPGSSNDSQMSAEQALYALAAEHRLFTEQNSLYRMQDAARRVPPPERRPGAGLPGKHADVQVMPIIAPGKSFDDIRNHANRPAIEALAERGIINGISSTAFAPDATMTRAEFAAIVTRGLGLPPQIMRAFRDVSPNSWFAGFVGAAFNYGIVAGVSPSAFNPHGTITRQEAAVMITRAARLCGAETAIDTVAVRNILAQFGDYTTIDEWAREALAFCFEYGIIPAEEFNIQPKKPVIRAEIAQMLFNMLKMVDLI